MSVRVGPFEIRDGVIGRPYHTGTRDGVDFNELWKPGDDDDKLAAVLRQCEELGKEQRTQEIGRLLGVTR